MQGPYYKIELEETKCCVSAGESGFSLYVRDIWILCMTPGCHPLPIFDPELAKNQKK